MNCNTTHYRANSSSVPGDPTFLNFFNVQFGGAIEKNDANQSEVLERLEEQLALILEAQATADAALAAAEGANGSKVGEIATLAGAVSGSVTTTVVAGSYIELNGALSGGSLDADAPWLGEAELTETDGMTTNSLGIVDVTTNSSGLDLGGTWQAEDSSPIIFAVWGTLSGPVTYALTVTRTGGSNYVTGATINAIVRITPPA